MTDLQRLTEQSTNSPPAGILAVRCVANGYTSWPVDRPPTADLLPPVLNVIVGGLKLETFLLSGNILASTDQLEEEFDADEIVDLGEAGYQVLQPIPVNVKRMGPRDFEASFREANIAMSGNDNQDAFEALVAEILETFDVLTAEQTLGPDAAEQLRILRTYIGRT